MDLKNKSKTIGYWLSEKKCQKMNWTELSILCKKHNFHLVKIDLNKSLEDQGPFDVILHKLTDIIVAAKNEDTEAIKMIERVERYILSHPEVVIIDPLPNVCKLLDRYTTYSTLNKSGLQDVFIPTFVELTSEDLSENLKRLKNAGVQFPFVCKPCVAHGSSSAHKMSVIFDEKYLSDCKPPCVAQTFINHNAILYKIFIVGEEFHVVERPSLKNFYSSDRPSIHFESSDVSKAASSSELTILDPIDAERIKQDPPKYDFERFERIASTLRRVLGLQMIGIDVVIENNSNNYAIIDVNSYPGYDGFPHFFKKLIRCIEQRLALEEDSGFDTGDSSDEKKKKTNSNTLCS